MSEFNDIPSVELSQRWTRSVISEAIHDLEILADDAADCMEEVWFSRELEPHLSIHSSIDPYEDQWDDVVSEIMQRPYYVDATAQEQRRIRTALVGDPRWVYTSERKTDGLWDETAPALSAPLNKMSRFVLSGALGDAILEDFSGLRRQAELFTQGRLNTAILIGGAATYMHQRLAYRETEQGLYHALDTSGMLEWKTYTGGDLHGDFRSSRSARPVHPITDTSNTGFEHHFMPAIEETSVGAYHSVEPDIVSGLLYYLVAHKHTDRVELHDRLLRKLEASDIKEGGAFADYGDGDGARAAKVLAYRLQHAGEYSAGEEKHLYQSVVEPDPQSALSFNLQSQPDGVAFIVNEDTRVVSEMFIPHGEVEQYIVTLIAGGGGRTSPGAMLRSIKGLVESD